MSSQLAALRIAVVALTLTVPRHTAHAQQSAGVARSDTGGRSLHLRVGGGMDIAHQYTKTANGLIGLDWQRPGSRFSLRTGLDYSRRESRFDDFVREVPGQCDSSFCHRSTVTQLAALSVDGRFDFMKSRFRPYVVSGASLNLAMRDDESNTRCDTGSQCVLTPGQFAVHRQETVALGLHAGVGLSMQVRRAQLFTEVRVQTLTNALYGNGSKPMIIGIRF